MKVQYEILMDIDYLNDTNLNSNDVLIVLCRLNVGIEIAFLGVCLPHSVFSKSKSLLIPW